MASEQLRILHVFRAPLGGLFRHVMDVARGQVERGHAVGIFCDSSTGGKRADAALAELAPILELGVTRVAMRRLPHPLDFTALASLTATFASKKPNVLHGHGSKGGLFARLVALPGRDAIRVYTPHGGSFNYRPGSIPNRVYMAAEKLLSLRTDMFLFESGYVAGRFDAFVGSTTRPTRVVYNGISDSEFEPLPRNPDPFDFVYIGELRAAKGIETLIDALSIIRRRLGRRHTLLVVGSGPLENELKARSRSAGVWDSVAFVPPQPVRAALARGRIMVIPSRAESLPYVILEAAAAGQPLVSTNVGGISEIFGHFADQLFAPDDPKLLAERMLRKLDQPELVRNEEARALSDLVRSGFSMEQMVEGGLAGYRAALDARDGGATKRPPARTSLDRAAFRQAIETQKT